MDFRFKNRSEAGRLLATQMKQFTGRRDVAVLALPRGGVPVAFEIARELTAPLDVFLVRKLGVPMHEELAMGAMASGGVMLFNQELIDSLRIDRHAIDLAISREKQELERREKLYRRSGEPLELRDRIVILVDDGLATGASMRAAMAAVRLRYPASIVVAVPVADREVIAKIRKEADDIICARVLRQLFAIGEWYVDFSQTTDEEVRDLLARAAKFKPADSHQIHVHTF